MPGVQLDLFPAPLPPVLVVPNHWGAAFHVVRGNRTVDHPEQPAFFYSIEEAFAWATDRGHQPAVDLHCQRWGNLPRSDRNA